MCGWWSGSDLLAAGLGVRRGAQPRGIGMAVPSCALPPSRAPRAWFSGSRSQGWLGPFGPLGHSDSAL